jgi:hypothetical protein
LTNFTKLLTTAFLVLGANSLFATSFPTNKGGTSPCATPISGSPGGSGGVSSTYLTDGGGCNVLITFNADGSITTTNPNSAISYDAGQDDNLVGIVNNSGHTINSLTFTNSASGADPFGFDGDGICAGYGFAGGVHPCTGSTDPNGYGPTGVTFSAISSNDQTGTVNFAGGIASGSSGFFSLEDAVSKTLTVSAVPEPASVVLFGSLLLGVGTAVRRRLKN